MANEMKMEKNECAPQMNQPNVNESVRRRRRRRHYYYYCYYYSLSSTSLKPNTLCSQQAQATWMWCILKNVSATYKSAQIVTLCAAQRPSRHTTYRLAHYITVTCETLARMSEWTIFAMDYALYVHDITSIIIVIIIKPGRRRRGGGEKRELLSHRKRRWCAVDYHVCMNAVRSLYKNNNNILNRGYCRWQKTDECKAIRMGWYWIRVNLVSIWFLIERLCTFIHVVYSIPSIFHFSFHKTEPPCITCNTVYEWMQSKCYRLPAISIFFALCRLLCNFVENDNFIRVHSSSRKYVVRIQFNLFARRFCRRLRRSNVSIPSMPLHLDHIPREKSR